MTAAAIRDFNHHVEKELELVRNIPDFPRTCNGMDLSRTLKAKLTETILKGLIFADGHRADAAFFKTMACRMNMDAIPEQVPVRFGVVTAYTDQRVLPFSRGLFSDPQHLAFDRLQNSALDMGTVVAVVHESDDGRWLYVHAPLSEGWVAAHHIAWCTRQQAADFDMPTPFVVGIRAKADIFLDAGQTRYLGYVRMGTRLPLAGFARDQVAVQLPRRGHAGRLETVEAYISGNAVSNGFLSYTPRNIITLAFECLNAPYGWGGMHGEQDCSRFIQSVFAAVGIELPRNSSAQAKVGRRLGFDTDVSGAEKQRILLHTAEGGTTLLHLDGHVMLYLGEVDTMPYAIHALWGYGESHRGTQRVRVTHAVRVTSLSLGSGSAKGSLLERLTEAATISGNP